MLPRRGGRWGWQKSENCLAPTADPRYHGRNGPLTIVNPPHNDPHELVKAFVQAGHELGLPRGTDYNAPDTEGAFVAQVRAASPAARPDGFRASAPQPRPRLPRPALRLRAQSNIGGGERCDTARAFLDADTRKARKNLTVVTLAHVTRILFQGTAAIGVAYRRGSVDPKELQRAPTQIALARREVIVCAGAVNTPWLLQLSGAATPRARDDAVHARLRHSSTWPMRLLVSAGIGPRHVLEPLGIPVVADLPVGEVRPHQERRPQLRPT